MWAVDSQKKNIVTQIISIRIKRLLSVQLASIALFQVAPCLQWIQSQGLLYDILYVCGLIFDYEQPALYVLFTAYSPLSYRVPPISSSYASSYAWDNSMNRPNRTTKTIRLMRVGTQSRYFPPLLTHYSTRKIKSLLRSSNQWLRTYPKRVMMRKLLLRIADFPNFSVSKP